MDMPTATTAPKPPISRAGPLGPLVGLLSRAMTRRYLGLEARGLKVRAETLA